MEKYTGMVHLEQYVQKVINYSSRYNNSFSYSYAPINIVGPYTKYPSYGDFPEAYFLRSYGKWWQQSKSTQLDYRSQDRDSYGAEDYVTLEFENAVLPRDICIYEIYNPGAVVRIWGKLLSRCSSWILLWEGYPQKCPPKSRKFHPEIKPVDCLINQIRLEFNQRDLEYHTSIEAVLLGGYQPTSELQYNIIMKQIIKTLLTADNVCATNAAPSKNSEGNESSISILPYEVILHVFQYLDLKSLSRCAQVNRKWNQVAADSSLYQNINLKPYWHLVDCNTLEYFIDKCRSLRKLDLAWCGNDIFGFFEKLVLVLRCNSSTIIHLSLNDCYFVNNELMNELSTCSQLIDIRLKNTYTWVWSSLHKLNKIVSLDLTATNIQDDDLIKLLKSNSNLEHLIIDLCENLFKLDEIASTVSTYNKKLVTWSSWKTMSFSFEGVKHFANCTNLEELDLGWCCMTDPGNCLEQVSLGCKKLKRLILSEWRGVSDHQLLPVILYCKELTQLDLLGIKNVSAEICERALLLLPKLRLLDISFCDSIRQDEVDIWRQQYPHITIQRSCQYVVTEYLNTDFIHQ